MLRIAEARNARGWTQEQLANALNTTQATIQRWESGKVDPQSSRIVEISKALGITVSFLLGVDSEGRETNTQPSPALSTDERELLFLYRRMDAENRARMMDNARAFAALSEKDGAGDRADVERAGRVVAR